MIGYPGIRSWNEGRPSDALDIVNVAELLHRYGR